MTKIQDRQKRRQIAVWLVVLFAFLLMAPPVMFAGEGPGGGGYENTSNADSSNFLTSGVNKIGSGLANLFGVKDLFSELSSADVGHKPKIRPHFAFNQGFVSNARLASNQADAAWQARVAPGITFSIPSGKLFTEVDYTYGFSTTQGRKTHANVSTHNISALARYDLSADTVIGVGNNLQLSEVPGEGGDTFVLETATAQVRHRLGPKLNASLTDTFQWFKDQTETSAYSQAGTGNARNKEFNNEFIDNGVALALSYDVTKDLIVGPTFGWNVRNFEKANAKDYWQIQPAISGSYRLGPKTTLSGNFGWAFRSFDTKVNTTQGSHESELVYGAGASHKLGRKLVWSVSYAKTLQDTFDTSFVFKDTPESTALDNLDRDFRLIKSHRIGSSVTYHLNERNSIGGFGDFSFLSGDADDNIITHSKNNEKSMELGARYTFRINRYIGIDVLYAFGRRFSGDNSSPVTPNRHDYTFHKVTGGVNIAI